MAAHVLLIGGEDHHLRLPFMIALRERGFRVTAAASGDPAPFAHAGLDYRSFAFDRFWAPRSDIRAIATFTKLMRETGADIAHCFDTKLTLLTPFAARSVPGVTIVRTINGRGSVFSSRSLGALALRALYLPLQRLAAASTAATVFEHHGDQAFFERHWLIGRSESIVIPGAGIDVEGFEAARAAGPDPAKLREELELTGTEVVTRVTRVTRQKGIPTLLEAAALVHAFRPAARFLIVGPRTSEGPFGVSDAEFDRHRDYVRVIGSRDDVPSLLAMSDVFAFPSEYAEGVPRALMEAALCGLPIVTTDLPGCREVVRDGWNGLTTPLRDPPALAAGIIRLLRFREAAALMGARGPDVIRQAFSLDKVVAGHAELYERQLREPRQQGLEARAATVKRRKAAAHRSTRPAAENSRERRGIAGAVANRHLLP
jgi:glycosyltransferase involved in cell wall biosynthesis